jgi:hypothetical protein
MIIVFPNSVDAWRRHNATVRSIWFTVGLFGAWVARFWRWRNRGVMWITMSTFLALHIVGVFLYSTQVHALDVEQWLVLLIIESLMIFLAMKHFLRRFSHMDRSEWDRHL